MLMRFFNIMITYFNVGVFFKINDIRKITIANSVRYTPQSEITKEREVKQNTIKNISPPRKQKKNISQNNRTLFENLAAQGFGILKSTMNCYV